jgi:leucyl-tRNA synthetase
MGGKKSIYLSAWPSYQTSLLTSDTFKMMVQVNGKIRGEIEVGANLSDEDIVRLAVKNERVLPYINGQKIKKTIVIKGKIVSLVI